ncbi:uncharacterized protein TNCV_34731 [Trichonephila clavipes]|nr:uncharacterized protein TNCV_34731 [Trichonephila clavipes]
MIIPNTKSLPKIVRLDSDEQASSTVPGLRQSSNSPIGNGDGIIPKMDIQQFYDLMLSRALLPTIHGATDVDINEARISTPVAVDQRAANCLEETVRSFTTMRSRCQSSLADVTFHRPLPVFRGVRCSSVNCFLTRIIVELFHCTRAPIAR